jgi:hypothetical protein
LKFRSLFAIHAFLIGVSNLQAASAKERKLSIRHSAAVDDEAVKVGAVFAASFAADSSKSADADSVNTVT